MAIKLTVSKKRKNKIKYQPNHKKYNFLKYWRVVKYYIKNKYELSEPELEMLLFLYDEDLFSRETFNEFASTMSWDKRRFSEMKKRGYIKVWRERKQTQRSTLYELTFAAKRICDHTYKKLMREEIISENPYRNTIFKGASYTDKIYKNIIKSMNSKTLARSDS